MVNYGTRPANLCLYSILDQFLTLIMKCDSGCEICWNSWLITTLINYYLPILVPSCVAMKSEPEPSVSYFYFSQAVPMKVMLYAPKLNSNFYDSF